MAGEEARQICGNCGAPNDPDAAICIVCGAVLSAYGQQQQADAFTTSTTPSPVTPTTTPAPSGPPSTAGDWRSMFESRTGRQSSVPESPPNLDRRSETPIAATTTTPAPVSRPQASPAPTTTRPPSTTPAPARQPERTRTPPEPTQPNPAQVRPAPWERPRADSRFNRRRPQTMVAIGLFLLLMGCVLSIILAAVGASDVAIAFTFLCLTPLGFVAIVAAIVIAISRREGRGR